MSVLRLFNPNMRALEASQHTPFSREFMQWMQAAMREISQTIVPLKGIVYANLSAADIAAYFTGGLGNSSGPYANWAICDGNNGTPNLDERFVRSQAAGAGATGGSDSSAHTHAIDHDHASFASGAESGHTHAIDHDHASFTSGAESGHTHSVTSNVTVADHAAHTHTIDHDHGSFTSGSTVLTTSQIPAHDHGIAVNLWGTAGAATLQGGATYGGSVVTGTSVGGGLGHDHSVDVPVLTGTSGNPSATLSHTVTNNAVTSGASSGHTHAVDPPAHVGTSGASSGHTHTVDVPALTGTSGAASATENRPAYYELVPLMRVA